jgi:hypothetical protein
MNLTGNKNTKNMEVNLIKAMQISASDLVKRLLSV